MTIKRQKNSSLFTLHSSLYFKSPSDAPLSPVATVEHAVADGLGQMVNLDTLRPVEVGNGACNLQDAALFFKKQQFFLIKNLQMRNIIINFAASKYDKNGKYGDYKERRPRNHSAT